MMTPTEMNNLLAEVNKAFAEDRRRLEALEERVKELEGKKTVRGNVKEAA